MYWFRIYLQLKSKCQSGSVRGYMDNSFFSINTQFENVGDALINREMIQLAAENSNVFVDFSRCPLEFVDTLDLNNNVNLSAVKGGFLGLCFKMLKMRFKGQACYYFLSPGGYFGEVKGKELLNKLLTTVILLLMSLVGIKICHVGVSYERLGARFSLLTRFRSLFLSSHIVRDKLTADYLASNKIKYDFVGVDLAFNLFGLERPRGNDVFVSFRCDQDERQFELAKAIVVKLHSLLPADSSIVFYSQVSRDSVYMKDMHAYFNLNYSSVRSFEYLGVHGDIDGSLTVLSRAKCIISNRLHVLLMASSKGACVVPCVLDGYNQKIEGIMSDLIGDSCLDMTDIDSESFKYLWDLNLSISDKAFLAKEKLANDFRGIYGN